MNTNDQYLEDDASGLVFGYRSFLVPGRKIEISFSVRKKSAFPLVEELLLKVVNVIGGVSLHELVTFLDFTAKEVQDVISPLLRMGLIIQIEEEFQLSEVGKNLFASSEDGSPAITESESRMNSFLIDDFCGMPVESRDLREHLGVGSVKWLVNDLQVKGDESVSVTTKVALNFSEYFSHFIRSEAELEKIRDEQLYLHKTEYLRTKSSFPIKINVQGVIRSNGGVENQVLPFDLLRPRTDGRLRLREAAIESAKIPLEKTFTMDVEFVRGCFGQDFLEGCMQAGFVTWFKLLPIFFSGKGILPRLKDGSGLVIGEACVPRNLLLIDSIIGRVLSGIEISPKKPLRIVWLRPSVASWGRSIEFLEGIKALREIVNETPKGSVSIELWANWHEDGETLEPQLKSYWPWFDDIRVFRSSEVPQKIEMLLIGDSNGLILTHAFTPPNACFPCPVGVCFQQNKMVQTLIVSKVEPKLRSLPRPQKPEKKQFTKAKIKEND